jgi:phosphoribosylformimino-5-aminoimidazole carboxamide ribotide isomerase
MTRCEVFPAIDLRGGRVVRLAQGDPDRQTIYGDHPGETARRWLDAGTRWLHVVNLDGAFGQGDDRNLEGLAAILSEVGGEARVQLGGGLRTLQDVERILERGVTRVVLGTVAVERPELVAEAVQRFGADRIAVGLDARDGRVKTKGWTEDGGVDVVTLGRRLHEEAGATTVIYTDIARDGVQTGPELETARELAASGGISVIASGGVASLEDIRRVREAELAGVIVGRALYEGLFTLEQALEVVA